VATLTEATAVASRRLTEAFKAQQNREAAKVAALVALYYQQRVNVEDPRSVERWLDLVIPRLISTSDTGARNAASFFDTLRRLEVPGAAPYAPQAALGMVDPGVRKSLIAVGPGAYLNKARDIGTLEVSPQQRKALLLEAKQVSTTRLAAAAVRHAQAGGRETIHRNTEADRVALGYVRVTRAKPCHFCAMLASRGLTYRAYKQGAFDDSDARFTGDGNAKVHDQCGCSLKPVYVTNDPLVAATEKWADMWERWGAGGGDAALRFRRGYTRWAETGEFMSFEDANEGLRAA
jgi:hypothetical protein